LLFTLNVLAKGPAHALDESVKVTILIQSTNEHVQITHKRLAFDACLSKTK
jgi:hypothetical protein